MIWGVMDLLQRAGSQIQSFRSQASFCPWDAAATITGQSSRHLDSWVQNPAECRKAFCRGARTSDFSIVDGCFAAAPQNNIGSSLETICGWLNLPRVAVFDRQSFAACRLPDRPAADAILLDGVADSRDFHYWQTAIEALWSIPVLGGMQSRPMLRTAVQDLSRGTSPSRELCSQLGDALAGNFNLPALRRLAERHEFPLDPAGEAAALMEPPAVSKSSSPITVAMAYDDAFRGYFPDTLDLLENLGVRLIDFSPLRDADLPANTDIVYFGCGQPEKFAHELSRNECMVQALRNHLCAGKRIYAEACSLAYLCQYLDTPETGRVRMVGIFPATAWRNPKPQPPRPLEVTLARHTWLGLSCIVTDCGV